MTKFHATKNGNFDEKTIVQTKTWKPYCIQRGKFEHEYNMDKKGIDILLNFDYMGSSEFEFGALPKSIKFIREHFDNYIFNLLTFNGKDICVIYPNYYLIDDIITKLASLSKNEPYLQEYSDFDTFIYNKQHYLKTNFWWDIENHIMFWFNDELLTTDLLIQIKGEFVNKNKKFFHKCKFERIESILNVNITNSKNFILKQCSCGERKIDLIC